MRVAMYYGNRAIFRLLSLRGAQGDEAILVEMYEIATLRSQ
jgi:hypothetical protein